MATGKPERQTEITKGKSPFYPGQPVPVELFVGRHAQIERIMTRGAAQVSQGKPIAIYVQGEYGIGKSSIGGFVAGLAERDYGLHGIYAPLGGARTVTDVAAAVLEATVRSGAFDLTRSDRVKEWLGKYIGKQALFGITIDLAALKRDAPNLSTPFGMLAFLGEAVERLKDVGVRGVFLVLDEINGITVDPQFAHFIKGLVDTNAMSKTPLPLLLMLCGVEGRRREMIEKHQPIERIFDVIEIEPMSEQEMIEFFTRSFESVGIEVAPNAMNVLTRYSAGFPKIMHVVGDSAYWINTDSTISMVDASQAVVMAANEVGAKYVDQQVYRALRSTDYHSILAKIAKMGPEVMRFSRNQVAADLTDGQKKKLDNFLRKMKLLNVIRAGDVRGEYVFNTRMVRVYIWLQSLESEDAKK
jgi:hypothetical protein